MRTRVPPGRRYQSGVQGGHPGRQLAVLEVDPENGHAALATPARNDQYVRAPPLVRRGRRHMRAAVANTREDAFVDVLAQLMQDYLIMFRCLAGSFRPSH